VLARGRVVEVRQGVLHVAAVQELEPELCVLFLVVRRLSKNRRDLLVSCLARLGRVIGILVARLRLAENAVFRFCSVLVPLSSFIFLTPCQIVSFIYCDFYENFKEF
jgi:hypothetical protein